MDRGDLMALIPIEHEHALASPAAAAAFYRALGEKRVSVRGLHTRDAARIERLVAAIDPKRDHTLSFEGGTLDHAALAALATARFDYLDLRTTNASLRIWPARHTWVHGQGDPSTVAELANPPAGTTVTRADGGYPIGVETTSIAFALGVFRALSSPAIERGFIMNGVRSETHAVLARFLVAIGAQVHAVLDVEVDVARSLTELYAGDKLDWQAYGILVDFPAGRIHGYIKLHELTDRRKAKWQARIAKALQRAAKLSRP